MSQSSYNIKKPFRVGVVTALSFLTLSSNMASASYTASQNPIYAHERFFHLCDYTENLRTSSFLAENARGDILMPGKESRRYENHTKIAVQLQIMQVKQHVSQFDFDEDYEEI